MFIMYLALKWLFLLTMLMWLMLCSIDIQMKKYEETRRAACYRVLELEANNQSSSPANDRRNIGLIKDKLGKLQERPIQSSYLHYLTFVAGALVVSAYNKQQQIISCLILFSKVVQSKLQLQKNTKKILLYLNTTAYCLKVTAMGLSAVLSKKLIIAWKNRRLLLLYVRRFFPKTRNFVEQRNENLLKSLREMLQERNKLALLLVAAIEENKHVKKQCQVEHLAKTRLALEILNTQKQIKEHRTKHVSFQQLYLVTHQENIFLKNYIKRLTRDKAEADKNLMQLVSKVYQSNDHNLKTYCTSFIVKNKERCAPKDEDLQNQKWPQDLEVRKWPQTLNPTASSSLDSVSECSKSMHHMRLTEASDVFDFLSEEQKPEMRSMPGEYVWTVKDKDGIIEKLYEYDYGFDFNNGDRVRRIREYSVFHDKDCLLDFANSRSTTIIHDRSAKEAAAACRASGLPFPSQRNFLTASPVFQKFLRNNHNFALSRAPSPPLLCG